MTPNLSENIWAMAQWDWNRSQISDVLHVSFYLFKTGQEVQRRNYWKWKPITVNTNKAKAKAELHF